METQLAATSHTNTTRHDTAHNTKTDKGGKKTWSPKTGISGAGNWKLVFSAFAPRRNKEKISGSDFKIRATNLKKQATNFPPRGNPFENRPKNTDKNNRALLRLSLQVLKRRFLRGRCADVYAPGAAQKQESSFTAMLPSSMALLLQPGGCSIM